VTGLRTGSSGVRSPYGKVIFLFSKSYRVAFGPTQPPLLWVPSFFSGGKNGRLVKLATHLQSSADNKNEWSIPLLRLLSFMASTGKTAFNCVIRDAVWKGSDVALFLNLSVRWMWVYPRSGRFIPEEDAALPVQLATEWALESVCICLESNYNPRVTDTKSSHYTNYQIPSPL